MGFAFAAGLVVPLRFAPSYYRTLGFERGGRIYKRLGVRLFQRSVRLSGVHGAAPFPRYTRLGGLGRLIADTHAPEAAHAMIFVVVLIVTADALRRGWVDTACWLLLFNVVLNAYPVLSMRDIRARIDPAQADVRRLHGAAATSSPA